MSEKAGFIGADVGGTTVDVGVVSAANKLVGPVQKIDSPSNQELTGVVSTFENAINTVQRHANLGRLLTFRRKIAVLACGIAMPGPFDFEQGISYMEHKFKNLYGKNLKDPLEERLDMPVFFVNDADAFGLGVSCKEYPNEPRMLCVTLGTGLGSAFVVDGRIAAANSDGVPPDGEIWNMPFKGGILEQKVSKERITQEYADWGGRLGVSVKDIIKRSRLGETAAMAATDAYARDLGAGLAMVSECFRPTKIVLGGRISNGMDVFAPAFEAAFEKRCGDTVSYAQTQLGHAAIYGAAQYASQAVETA